MQYGEREAGSVHFINPIPPSKTDGLPQLRSPADSAPDPLPQSSWGKPTWQLGSGFDAREARVGPGQQSRGSQEGEIAQGVSEMNCFRG